jgi:hypothetical protein
MDSGIGIGGLSTGKDEYVTSAFDLFTSTEVENSIQKAHRLTYRPISVIAGPGPFNFEIPADPEKFTDAETIRLHGAIRIRKKNSNGIVNIDSNDKVSPINNIFDSLWEKVITILNGVDISDPNAGWYAYKAYLENHLSYSKSSKDITLHSKGYIKDTAGKFDDVGVLAVPSANPPVTARDSSNTGFINRAEQFAGSEWVYFCNNVHIDICTLRRYIPPGFKIELQFHRNKDNFCLLSPATNVEYVIEVKDLQVRLSRYEVTPAIKKYVEAGLHAKKRPILPIDRSIVKNYVVTSGTSDLSHYNLITGKQLPDQVFVAIVDHSAHTGSLQKNPFNFQDFNLMEASLVVNGVNEPTDLYRLNKSAGDKANLYFNFLENTGVSTDDREFGVTMKDYYGGSLILAFDRSPDKCNRYHRHPYDSGSIDINIKTKVAISTPVTVIVYATYATDIIIDDGKIISSTI